MSRIGPGGRVVVGWDWQRASRTQESLKRRNLRKGHAELTFFSSAVHSTRPIGMPALSLKMIDVTPSFSLPACPELLLLTMAHSINSSGRSRIFSSSNKASIVSREYRNGRALLLPLLPLTAGEVPLTVSPSWREAGKPEGKDSVRGEAIWEYD